MSEGQAKCQFFRGIGVARKATSGTRSLADIIAEARRDPHASPHVAEPRPPIVRYGPALHEAEDVIEARLVGAVDRRGRKLASTSRVMLAIVASFPTPVAEIEADPAKADEYEKWLELNLEVIQARWQRDLVSIIEHRDERFPHIHAWIVPHPDANGFFDIEKVFRPFRAEGEARRAKLPRQARRELFKAAARQEQAWYHEKVGAPLGLARVGPRRRRMSRLEWATTRAEEAAAARVAEKVAAVARMANERIIAAAHAARTDADRRIAENRRAMETHVNDFIEHHTAAERIARAKAEENAELLSMELERLKAILEENGLNPMNLPSWPR